MESTSSVVRGPMDCEHQIVRCRTLTPSLSAVSPELFVTYYRETYIVSEMNEYCSGFNRLRLDFSWRQC